MVLEENNNQLSESAKLEVTPKKIGRPRGRKDSKKRVSLFIKMQAKSLYIAGHSPIDIAKAVGIAHEQQITNWAAKEDWDVERDRILGLTTAELVRDMMISQKKTFSDLKTIRQKAMDSIINENVNPQKYSEATNAYIASLEMEYKIKSESLQVSFINDVAQVLKIKIQDRSLLTEIANELRRVFEKYQQRQLSPSVGQEE